MASSTRKSKTLAKRNGNPEKKKPKLPIHKRRTIIGISPVSNQGTYVGNGNDDNGNGSGKAKRYFFPYCRSSYHPGFIIPPNHQRCADMGCPLYTELTLSGDVIKSLFIGTRDMKNGLEKGVCET